MRHIEWSLRRIETIDVFAIELRWMKANWNWSGHIARSLRPGWDMLWCLKSDEGKSRNILDEGETIALNSGRIRWYWDELMAIVENIRHKWSEMGRSTMSSAHLQQFWDSSETLISTLRRGRVELRWVGTSWGAFGLSWDKLYRNCDEFESLWVTLERVNDDREKW